MAAGQLIKTAYWTGGRKHSSTLVKTLLQNWRLWGVGLLFVSGTVCGQVTIFPSAPRAQETVFAQVASLPISSDSFDATKRNISMSSNRITVELGTPDAVFLPTPGPTPPLTIELGQFPPGNYEVTIRRQLGASGTTEKIGDASFTVQVDPAPIKPLENFTDLWWNPTESGWGLNIVQHGSGIIFATWFNYSPDGKPIWYVVPEGHWVRTVEYRGPIYRTTGPPVGPSFNPSFVTRTLVGDVVFQFSPFDSMRMTASFTVDGTTFSKELQRQGF